MPVKFCLHLYKGEGYSFCVVEIPGFLIRIDSILQIFSFYCNEINIKTIYFLIICIQDFFRLHCCEPKNYSGNFFLNY